jgi:ADP-ribose pyrophosphatase
MASDRQTRLTSGFGLSDVEVQACERMYDGFGKLDRYRLRHKRFDGSMTPEVSRELFQSGDAVVLLPYDPVRDEIVLIEQMRVSALSAGEAPWIVETIAGRIGEGESDEDVARREALEEAGLTVGRLERIGRFYSSPGIFAERFTAFCGLAQLDAAGGVHGLAEEQEDIRAFRLSAADAFDALARDEIQAAPAALCLSWLMVHRDRLRAAASP